MQQVSVRDCRDEDRRWIAGIYRDYLNDLAASATGLFPALPEFGHREPDQLSAWFAAADTRVLTVLYSEEPVGFAKIKLLNPRTQSSGGRAAAGTAARERGAGASSAATTAATAAAGAVPLPEFSMAEFFIARPWRRRGIGAQAVRLILDRFTGRWLISELLRNDTAVRFWRRVVGAYTGGAYQESVVDGEVRQRFQSGTRRRVG
jgi:GNAT superfamily N-acetyltransferase